MISVVIPLYNKEKQIASTLQSVLNQSFQDFEVVIVDDGSTDGSVDVVKRFSDPRIRVIKQKNAGVSVARNRGIEEANGEYVALLDGDDEWLPVYLETQIALAAKYPQCDVFATNYKFRNQNGQETPTIIRNLPFKSEDGVLSNYFQVASTSHPPICSISIMARKEAFLAIGGFPAGIKSGEDLLTWARLACKYKIAYSNKPLAVFIETPPGSNESKAKSRSGGEQFVLDQLLLLCRDNDIAALKDYIIRWYRIYCILLIEIGDNHKIPTIALQAIKFGGSPLVFSALILFGLLPSKFALFLFNKILR